jgi:hypothetical protein
MISSINIVGFLCDGQINLDYGWCLTQLLQKLQDELKLRSEELHAAEDTIKKLVNEKISLEERISGLEKNKADEVILFPLEFDFRNLYCFHGL